MFGGAVRDFGNRSLGSIGEGILRGAVGNPEGEGARPFSGAWQSTKYAADLINYAPKHRFMFKVQFRFNKTYVSALAGTRDPNAFSFLVKMVDRPKVEFMYEDVNFYNYRSKVLKEIRHDPLGMTFIDDIGNNTTDFFNAYRKALSPISRKKDFDSKLAMESGLNFSHPMLDHQNDSASRGVLGDDQLNVLDAIIVRQIFAHGTRMCEYTFNNPRILRFDFDEVNHENGEMGNGLTVQFDYDSLYVSEMMNTDGTPAIRWGTSDIVGNREGSGKSVSTADKIAGTIFDTAINSGTRIVGGMASTAIRNIVNKIPFVGPTLSGFAGNTANRIVTGIGRDTLRTASQGVNNSIAKAEKPQVSSNNAPADLKGTEFI